MTRRGILVAALAALAALLLWLAWPRDAVPEPGSTLVLELTGDLPERLAPVPLPPLLMTLARWLRIEDGRSNVPLAMLEIRQLLRAATSDPRIAKLRLEPHGLATGWAKLEELRHWVSLFARSGKPVDCYLRAPGMKEYFVASAATRLSAAPSDWLNLRGLRAEVISAKGLLDKLGVVAEMESIGRYKDAGDIVTREAMSPATREVLESFLDARLAAWTAAVAAGRNRSAEEIRRLLDDGPFLAAQARQLGLLDTLGYPPSGEKRMAAGAYRWLLPRPAEAAIAVLVIDGDIGARSRQELASAVERLEKSPATRGVLVRVDSPGGEVVASDEMLDLLRRLRSTGRRLVFSFSDVAASGGYALAMTGDRIHASPGTVTGSIGVLFGKADFSGLAGKLGLRPELLLRGKQAAIDSPFRPLGDEGRRRLRAALQTLYDSFVEQVAAARRLDRSRVAALAEGRAWLGSQALAHQLVDSVGGFEAALAELKQQLGLPAGVEPELALVPARDSWWERVGSGTAFTATAWGEAAGSEELGWWAGLGAEGAMARRLPYRIQVR